MQHKKCNYADGSIHYKSEGVGKAVIFLHGFGEDSSIWRNQEGKFPNFFCLYVDLPGSGESSFNSKLSSISDYAEVVNAVLENENLGNCIIIGHSMGGYIVLAFAELFPEKLKGLALFHSSAYADTEDKIANRNKSIEFVIKNGADLYFKAMLPDLFFNNEQSEKLIKEQIVVARKISDQAVIQYLKVMIGREDKTCLFQQLDIPIAFFLGEHDKAVPFALGLEQTEMASVTYVYILRQSAHMGMLEEADQVNKLLPEFLNACAN